MMKREKLMEKLIANTKDGFFNEGENFCSSYKGSIWTGEGTYSLDGEWEVFNYFSEDYAEKNYVMGVYKPFRKIVEDAGWMIECHDPGTYFIFPNE